MPQSSHGSTPSGSPRRASGPPFRPVARLRTGTGLGPLERHHRVEELPVGSRLLPQGVVQGQRQLRDVGQIGRQKGMSTRRSSSSREAPRSQARAGRRRARSRGRRRSPRRSATWLLLARKIPRRAERLKAAPDPLDGLWRLGLTMAATSGVRPRKSATFVVVPLTRNEEAISLWMKSSHSRMSAKMRGEMRPATCSTRRRGLHRLVRHRGRLLRGVGVAGLLGDAANARSEADSGSREVALRGSSCQFVLAKSP